MLSMGLKQPILHCYLRTFIDIFYRCFSDIYIYRAFRSIHFGTSIRSDPIAASQKNASIWFDPMKKFSIRSDPTQASKKKSWIRPKYFLKSPIRSNYLYTFNDLIKVLNLIFNQTQLEFYITLLQYNIIFNYFRCIFLFYFCLIMIKIVFIVNLHQ